MPALRSIIRKLASCKRVPGQKRTVIWAIAAAVVIIAAVLLLICLLPRGLCLVISDEETGRVYLRIPVEDGDRFSVTYTHSVHQTPVTETYEVRGTELYVVAARFYTFGAGMQTDYPEGVTWSYDSDGAIVAEGYDTLCKDLIYCVGKYYDHTLEYQGQVWSLSAACGRGNLVEFTIRRSL